MTSGSGLGSHDAVAASSDRAVTNNNIVRANRRTYRMLPCRLSVRAKLGLTNSLPRLGSCAKKLARVASACSLPTQQHVAWRAGASGPTAKVLRCCWLRRLQIREANRATARRGGYAATHTFLSWLGQYRRDARESWPRPAGDNPPSRQRPTSPLSNRSTNRRCHSVVVATRTRVQFSPGGPDGQLA